MDKIKTNAVRILEKNKINYSIHHYECDGFTDGADIAKKLGLDPEEVYKTLIAKGKSGKYYVFVIPVEDELDLKKAAKAAGEKNVEMIHVKDINAVSGYIRGGCSPVGMKKKYETFIESTGELEKIYVSAGRIGDMMCLTPEDLKNVSQAKEADLTRKEKENEF